MEQTRLFFSHSSKDDEFGQRLVADLRAHLGEGAVWYDSSGGLRGGDEWWNRIVAEITARDTFLVLLSPDALASDWVPREMGIAYWQHVKLGKRLLPLMYRSCELPTDWQLIQSLSFGDDIPYDVRLANLLRELGYTDAITLPPIASSTALHPEDSAMRQHPSSTSQAEIAIHVAAHNRKISALRWSPNGEMIASIPVALGRAEEREVHKIMSGPFARAESEMSKKMILSVKVWKATDGSPAFPDPADTDDAYDIEWSPDSKRLLCASDADKVCIINAESGLASLTFPGIYTRVHWSQDGHQVTAATTGRSLYLCTWDASTGAMITSETLDNRNKVSYDEIAWAPNAERLALVTINGLYVTGSFIKHVKKVVAGIMSAVTSYVDGVDDVPFPSVHLSAQKLGMVVHRLSWAPDSERIAVGGNHNFFAVLGLRSTGLSPTLTKELTCGGHDGQISALAWSQDGTRIASASNEDVRIWDASTGRLLSVYREHETQVTALAWSPDSLRIASGDGSGSLHIW